MNLTRRSLLSLTGLGVATGLAACDRLRPQQKPEPSEEPVEQEVPEEPEEPAIDLEEFEGLAIDPSAWSYDEVNDCYYQLALPYCLTPASEQYGTYAIFVPGAYFVGERGSRGFTCTIAEDAQVGQFTPQTAPVAMPINAMRFGAQASPSTYSYEGLSRYLEAGFVYVYAGFRGRSGGYESTTQEYFSGGIPWAVTDLKAAIRCLRYNAGVLPCDTQRVFVFGCGGGGSYSATLGASGNAPSFDPYLQEIGAATHNLEGAPLTDEVFGTASWCPLVSFGAMDSAYEWMMGQFATTDTRESKTWTSQLSSDLTTSYASYVNGLGLVDEEGVTMTLDSVDDGSYLGGTYYEHLLDLVRDSATAFLKRTKFPYTSMPASPAPPLFPGDPASAASAMGDTTEGEDTEESAAAPGVRQVEATVFETLESYVAYLNGNGRWLTYNASRASADVTGLWDFVPACRQATRAVGAYDALDRSGVINQLFGTDEESTLHFDAVMAELLEANHERYADDKAWDEGLVAQWNEDLAVGDTLDKTVTERLEMVDPLTYLCPSGESSEEDGESPVVVAPHWRINTGLFQAVTPLTTEVNLALAARACDAVSDLQFEVVWAEGYGLAERSGDAEDNLVSWIVASCGDTAQEVPDEAEDEADTSDDDVAQDEDAAGTDAADADAEATDADDADADGATDESADAKDAGADEAAEEGADSSKQ